MRTKKRKFQDFRYRECDAFAEYLHQQSLAGWHFKEWRFGLVFEQGEPKDIEYYVEIFPKSSEQDLRPGKDTQEFAEYCESAGWKLLDAHGKFCVFRKVHSDAVPIVEERERFENIKKAEHEKWNGHCLFWILWNLLQWFKFWVLDFETWAFESLMLFMLAIFTVATIGAICEGVSLILWERKQKERLRQGEQVRYGKVRGTGSKWLFRVVFLFMLAKIIVDQPGRTWFALLLFAVLLLISVIISFWRPLEEEYSIFLVIVFLVVLLWLAAATSLNWFDDQNMRQITDNHIVAGPSKSVLGEKAHGEIVISDENHSLKSRLTYDIYRSPYSWVVEKVWGIVWEKLKPESDCKEVWNAEKAYVTGGGGTYWYTVKYPDAVLEIYMESEQNPEGLNEEDVAVLLESLQLF